MNPCRSQGILGHGIIRNRSSSEWPLARSRQMTLAPVSHHPTSETQIHREPGTPPLTLTFDKADIRPSTQAIILFSPFSHLHSNNDSQRHRFCASATTKDSTTPKQSYTTCHSPPYTPTPDPPYELKMDASEPCRVAWRKTLVL